MNHRHRRLWQLVAWATVAGGVLGFFMVPVYAAPNTEINYQGKLTNSSDEAVADTTYTIRFRVYTALSGGSALFDETHSVTVTNGLFSVMLGSAGSSTADVDWSQNALYLGVNVNADGEMSPRKRIGSVPSAHYALDAAKLGGLIKTDFIATSTFALPNIGSVGSSTGLTSILGTASTSILRIDSLTDGCLSLTSGLVGSQACGGGSNSKWATSTDNTSIFVNGATKVGIGTSSPYARLSVHAGTNDTYNSTLFAIASSTASATSTHFTVLANGHVGIGTTSPYAALSVVGPEGVVADKYTATSTSASTFPYASSTALTVSGVASTSILRIDSLTDGCLSLTSGLVGSQACGGGSNSKWATSTDNTSIFVNGATKVGVGTTSPFSIFSVSTSTQSSSSTRLFTVASSTGKTLLSVLGSGQIVAGTSTPDEFTIAHFSADNANLKLESPLAGNHEALLYFAKTGEGITPKWAIGRTNWNSFNVNTLGFFEDDDQTNKTRLVIAAGGNIGVGTTTPAWLFQIASSSASNAAFRPQFTLTDLGATANAKHWNLTSQAGAFSIGTSSDTFATSTYLTIVNGGRVGIGTSTPNYKLTVNTGGFSVEDSATNFGGFQVSSNARTTSITGIPVSTSVAGAPLVINPASTGDVNRKLLGIAVAGVERMSVDVEGDVNVLNSITVPYASTTALSISGTAYIASLTGPLQAVNGTVSASSTLSVAYGGTGATTFTDNGVLYGNGGGALQVTAAGTGGQILMAGGSGVPQWIATSTMPFASSALTKGYFLVGSDAGVAQATSSIFVSSTGNVGIGTVGPSVLLEVAGTSRSTRTNAAGQYLQLDGGDANGIYLTANSALTAEKPFVIQNLSNEIPTTSLNRIDFKIGPTSSPATKMTIASTGNVGIGTSIPAQQLQVNGATGIGIGPNGGALYPTLTRESGSGGLAIATYVGATAVSTTHLTVRSTGFVGIGTTTPQKLLDVSSATRADILINNTNIGTAAGDTLGSLLFFNNDASVGGESRRIAAGIRLTTVTEYGPTRLEFTGGTTNPITVYGDPQDYTDNTKVRMVIVNTSGEIGMGTTSPYAKLSVHADTNSTYKNTLFAIASSTASATSTHFVVMANGKVGIGTTSPFSILSVSTIAQTPITNSLFTVASTTGAPLFTVNAGGYVGINVAPNNSDRINMSGGIRMTGNVYASLLSLEDQVIASKLADVNNQSYYIDPATVSTSMIVAGKVAVGTTSPYAYLSVHSGTNNTYANTLFAIASSTASATTTHFVVMADGKVGVGTTSPSALFSVGGNSNIAGSLTVGVSSTTASTNFGGILSQARIATANQAGLALNNHIYTSGSTGHLGYGLKLDETFQTDTVDGLPDWGYYYSLYISDPNRGAFGQSDTADRYWGLYVETPTFAVDMTDPELDHNYAAYFGGKVGINNTMPSYPLDVTGDINVTSGRYRIDQNPVIAVSSNQLTLGNQTVTSNILYGNLGVSTTTPAWLFQIASSSATGGFRPQFTITDTVAGTDAKHWNLTSQKGAFSIGTSSDTTFATSTYLTIANGGKVGISTTSPWTTFAASGTVSFANLTTSVTGNAVCITTANEITNAGAASCIPSSLRFKENVQTLASSTGMETLSKLRIVSFDYKADAYSPEDGKESLGIIAEEAELVDKRLVDYGPDGRPLTLHFERITALLVQAVQENKKQIDDLQSLIAGMSIDESGALVIDNLKVRNSATIGTPENRAGVTLYDEQSGAPYCLRVSGGVVKADPGECGSVPSSPSSSSSSSSSGASTPPAPGGSSDSDTSTSTPPIDAATTTAPVETTPETPAPEPEPTPTPTPEPATEPTPLNDSPTIPSESSGEQPASQAVIAP